MLASLLPGLRDVRTPLAVGYLYGLLLWLWIGDRLPRDRPPGDGLISRLFDLSAWLGTSVTLGAVAFSLYILGLLLTLPGPPIGWMSRWAGDDVAPLKSATMREYFDTVSELHFELLHVSRKTLDEYKRLGHAPNDSEDDPYASSIDGEMSNLPRLVPRLLVSSAELYGEYDRLASEARFRWNLILPLCALCFTVDSVWHGAWALALVVAAVLGWQSLMAGLQARTVLVRAIEQGIVQHPWETELEELRSTGRQ